MVSEKKTKDSRVNDVRGFYTAVFRKVFGFNPTLNFGKTGAVIKKLLSDFNEQQCFLLIAVHFNWRGMDNKDEFTYKRLRDRAFPIEWIFFNVNGYQAYIRNVLNIDFDNEEEVRKYVMDFIKDLR